MNPANQPQRKRYTVKDLGVKDRIRTLEVSWPFSEPFEHTASAHVWVSGDGSLPRCTNCSSPLRGMSSSCAHVAAAKRFLAKESANA